MILVGCSKTKLDHAAPARDLYTSHLFRLGRAYAESTGERWGVLSARHFLVMPGETVEPYDLRLDQLQPDYRRQWTSVVDVTLRCGLGVLPSGEERVTVLAGGLYVELLPDWVRERAVLPLAGMGIGKRKNWLIRAAAGEFKAGAA